MALRLFESFAPSAVVGFGGYPALPALLAATSAKIPSVIHEQNAVLGRVNRLLAGRVDAIATAYRQSRPARQKACRQGPSRRQSGARRCPRAARPAVPGRSPRKACCASWSPAAARARGCCPKWCPMASPCCKPRCGCACRSPSNAAPKISRRCARAMPGTIFPPNSAPISRTWPRGSPTPTCSSAAPVPRPSPS